MRRLDWRQWMVVLAFLLVLAATCFFAARAARPALSWHHHRDEAIRPWMTVGYVAHSYHVPRHVLYQALGLTPRPNDRRPLRRIALEQHRPVHEVIAVLRNAIDHARTPYPPPPPPAEPGAAP